MKQDATHFKGVDLMGVTIKDVAKKTGLSITTVSLVLNKKDSRISERTRQLIESAAQELNYTPNSTAVSLVTKKTKIIGLILPESGYYHFSSLIRSMESACRNGDYFLMVSIARQGDEDALELLESLVKKRVDGLVLDPSCLSAESVGYQEVLCGIKVPVVCLGCIGPLLPPNSIAPSHQQGGFLAMSHLLELGHRRIGCITGPASYSTSFHFWQGCQDALEEYGLAPDQNLLVQGPYRPETGALALGQLLQQNVTAVVTASDFIAWGVWQEALRRGLSVPEDLSITGYGDSLADSCFNGGLTSLTVHFDRIARKAVNLIRKWEETNTPSPPENIFPSLLCRSSSAPPRS